MSSGAKVVTAYKRETTPGTTPTSGDWQLLKRSSFGLGPSQSMIDNDEIGGSRMAQGRSVGTVDVTGDVSTKFRWGQHDDFLASCFGAEWNNNALTMGNDRITFSVASYAEDIGVASIARGAQVGTFQIEIPNDGDITATVTFAGLGWDSKSDSTSYFADPVDNAGEMRYSFKQVTNISLNGVNGGDGFCVDSFNLQFDNNLQTQRCIGTGNPFAGANIPTTFTPSGSVTLSWSKEAYIAWKKSLSGETMPFSFTLENDEGSYTFNLPSVQVDGDWPDGGNTEIIQVTLNITGADVPPTITRAETIPTTAMTVTPATSSGAEGSTVTLTANLTPAGATDTVTWESSDPSVAAVASTGQKTAQVTRVKEGTATITARVREYSGSTAITVTAP